MTVLIFAGARHYPRGGANDLIGELESSDALGGAALCEMFKRHAENECWLDDEYWMNTLVVGQAGASVVTRWVARIEPRGETDAEMAALATQRIVGDTYEYSLIPLIRLFPDLAGDQAAG